MDKINLLNEVKKAAKAGHLTRQELLAAFDDGKTDLGRPSRDLSKVLYYIGGLIVVLGIGFLIFQNWDALNDASKILTTLGTGIVAYLIGFFVDRNSSVRHFAMPFYLIALLVIPIGLHVTLEVAEIDVGTAGWQSIISAFLLFIALVSALFLRHWMFKVFSVIYGTWLFFAFAEFLMGDLQLLDEPDFFAYRFLVTGLSYCFFGYYLDKQKRETFVGALYGFGLLLFLVGGLVLGGWAPDHNMFWEIVYPGLALAVVFLSVYLRNRIVLVMGALFLVIYIFKITEEHFREGLGWPLALILMGLALITIGYIAVAVNQKYLKS